MKRTGQTVLITGGSAGIGLALTKAFLAEGNKVIVCGRDETRLARVQQNLPNVITIPCDISQESEILRMRERIAYEYGGISVLVNNAGIASPYNFLREEDSFQSVDEQVATNLLGTIKVTRLLLPMLLSRPEAAVLLLSSGVAYVPLATHPIYSATKAAVHSLAQSLRQQLTKTSVKVFEVLPPTVETEGSKSFNGTKIAPDMVAQAVMKGIERDVYDIRVGQVGALYLANRLSPALARRLLETVATPSKNAERAGRVQEK